MQGRKVENLDVGTLDNIGGAKKVQGLDVPAIGDIGNIGANGKANAAGLDVNSLLNEVGNGQAGAGQGNAEGLDVGSLISGLGNNLQQGQGQGQGQGGLDANALLSEIGNGQQGKGNGGNDIANIANQLGQGQGGNDIANQLGQGQGQGGNDIANIANQLGQGQGKGQENPAAIDIGKLASEQIGKQGNGQDDLINEILNGNNGKGKGKGNNGVEIIEIKETIIQVNQGGQNANKTKGVLENTVCSAILDIHSYANSILGFESWRSRRHVFCFCKRDQRSRTSGWKWRDCYCGRRRSRRCLCCRSNFLRSSFYQLCYVDRRWPRSWNHDDSCRERSHRSRWRRKWKCICSRSRKCRVRCNCCCWWRWRWRYGRRKRSGSIQRGNQLRTIIPGRARRSNHDERSW